MRTRVGVIIGRFQIADLHTGHKDLINYVRAANQQTLIILGVSAGYPTARNPLSWQMREAMIQKLFPDVKVATICDDPSDEVWSQNLDALVGKMFPDGDITFYGSRDSFLDAYSGKFAKEYFRAKTECSGTQYRQETGRQPKVCTDFLKGIIYAETNRPARTYQTVDIAVLNERGEVLLASKTTDGGKLRFIGGFVDPTDSSMEQAAKREVIEETGFIEVDAFKYIGSAKIDDWRYRGTEDNIMTTFFTAKYIFGAPRAQDDIISLAWVPLTDILSKIVPEHRELAQMLLAKLQ